MHWAAAIADQDDPHEALKTACEELRAALPQDPDLVVVFAHSDYGPALDGLTEGLSECFPDAVVIGCSAGGVLGNGREVEQSPSISVTAAVLPDVQITPFFLDMDLLDGRTVEEVLGLDPVTDPAFILLPDPFASVQPLVDAFDASYPRAAKVGGIASGGREPGSSMLYLGDETHREGMVGIAMVGDVVLEPVVAQGCRPVGEALTITRAQRNLIFELDHMPVVDALDQWFASLDRKDQQLFQKSPMAGIAIDEHQRRPLHGDYLVRDIVALDRLVGTLAVATVVHPGQVLRFHVRDPEASAHDLDVMLQRHARHQEPPAGALLFSCLGRGKAFYGIPHHDSRLFGSHFGKAPIGGFFCNGEIGPVRGRTFLHGYTSAFGLFRPRGWD